MKRTSLRGVATPDALDHIAQLVDASTDLREEEGLNASIRLGHQLRRRKLSSSHSALLSYYNGNAWSALDDIALAVEELDVWKRPTLENLVVSYRSALLRGTTAELGTNRMCQMFTNLGNSISTLGRTVEAIEYWDRALELDPEFGMTIGNRGCGLSYLASVDPDLGHQVVLVNQARDDLRSALCLPLELGASEHFRQRLSQLERTVSPRAFEAQIDVESHSLGATEAERQYRQWCLDGRLFLNTLNDLGSIPIAATDPLMLPDLTASVGDGPHFVGCFNQMKQEYVSARYILYDSIRADAVHYSDRDVTLANTLDYPCYSLSVEKAKMAFRSAYSLLDKVAFFLNRYLGLGMKDRDVSLRRIWYEDPRKRGPIRSRVLERASLPVKALFWLSRDLYEDAPGYRSAMQPDAQQLSTIRNHIEHRYVKLHQEVWSASASADEPMRDILAFSLSRGEFESKALRLLKLARAALLYLAHAVAIEERSAAKRREAPRLVAKTALGKWDDEWKL